MWIAYLEGREVWGNLENNIPNSRNIEPIELIEIVLNGEEIDNKPKLLILDEIKNVIDSRSSMSWFNKNFSYFVAQCRKMGFDIVVTDQYLGSFDIRMRELTDTIVRCMPIFDPNDVGLGNSNAPEPIAFKYIEYDLQMMALTNKPVISRRYYIPRFIARDFYKLYNTYQRIKPTISEAGE